LFTPNAISATKNAYSGLMPAECAYAIACLASRHAALYAIHSVMEIALYLSPSLGH